MRPRTRSRAVPVNTQVTLNCSTSNCDHVEMYMTAITQPDEETTLINCDTIDINGMLICRNITIVEPVEVRCVGRQSSGCHSWGSISIEIGNDTEIVCNFRLI